MTYKTVLVHAEPLSEAEPRLAVAASVARKFDATLIGLGAEMFDWVGVSDPYGVMAGEWLTVMQDLVKTDLAKAEALFREHAKGVPTQWTAVMEAPAQAMAELSRSADLIVAGGAPLGARGAQRTADPAELTLKSGRPVLVAPPHGGELSARQVVVGWKDSREARRALTDSLPFLQKADEVVVLEACDEDQVEDAGRRTAEVAEHLKRHGVAARGLAKASSPERYAVDLNIEAQAVGADLIVVGAYGHNRMQEWVLGGVTRDLLHFPERFVLFSH